MDNRIAAIITSDGLISLFVDEINTVIDRAHPNYDLIVKAIKSQDADNLKTLADIPKAIVAYATNLIEVINGEIFYKGDRLHGSLVDRILDLMNEGFPFEFMIRFLENLQSNPSSRAVNELYEFLENRGLPITEDGCFLAYKGVRSDWKDLYSGTIDNSIGNTIVYKRNQVDDDRAHQCSYGLHVGALEYVKNYCTQHVIVVKVNPADVVAVPRDHNAQKVRVCKYEVLREFTGELNELPEAAYSSKGEEFEPTKVWTECDDCCDDHDDCDCHEDDPYEYDPCDGCDEDCDYCRLA